MAMSLAAVPGRRSEVVGIFAAGDDVITENHYRGTLAESGEDVSHCICYVFHFVDGKVTDQREYG
jgi:ketosteroid isomerase-like protein